MDARYIGLDIGSVSVNAVLMDDAGRILEDHYLRTHGQPVETARQALTDLLSRTSAAAVRGLAVTGSGGKLISEILGCPFVNEIIAQSKGASLLHPELRTIIEIGGEDSKLILLGRDGSNGRLSVRDFAMNTLCAAGTGSFLDQQATRLGFTIEEFSRHALKSESPPRIAGRCSVFAKSDMIHLQQEATPDYDIVAGLCHAMARNFKSTIAKGKEFHRPIAFHGGVGANQGMVRAFETVLELEPGELLVPEHFASMGAIGAVVAMLDSGDAAPVDGLDALDRTLARRTARRAALEPLVDPGHTVETAPEPPPPGTRVDATVGVDVGSISTNVVVLSADGMVLARRYLMTAGRPIEAVVRGLKEVGEEVGDRVTVRGCATTGSGRYLTGDFIGADVVKNEITAHAVGAAWVDPEVDTIFEIGGQDSKYVSLEHGAVVDFAMNKVCAAGTGSFLEEQAERLGIDIIDEFGQRALASTSPASLGERCTVFMESDLNQHQQQGAPRDDLVAGLAYSIVFNYLNRVVEGRRVGDRIFFQGGVAANRAVVAAFEAVTGKAITVPPHHDVLGAVGAALIAREHGSDHSQFKGFDLTGRRYTVETFQCEACSNLCEVRRVAVEGDRVLHYGSRCGRYDEEKRAGQGDHLPQLFRERDRLLTQTYAQDKPDRPNGKTIGIPRTAQYFELFPLWKAYFTELGFQVVPSGRTNRSLVRAGLEQVASETCFPVKVAHGHVQELLESEVDYVFLPSVVAMEPLSEGARHACNCPYVQSLPYLMNAAMNLAAPGPRVLTPILDRSRGARSIEKALLALGTELGASRRRARKALAVAREAQARFEAAVRQRGREVIESLDDGHMGIVIVGRPYNTCDDGLSLAIPEKLRDLGAVAIPADFVPLDGTELGDDCDELYNMYWRHGQRILALARTIASNPRLHALYITNFGCGPDSFIAKYFARELRGRPYLTIEIDEHSADVGAITRCEAFLDSIANIRTPAVEEPVRRPAGPEQLPPDLTVYVPYMDDHARVFAAAMRHHGLHAVALPPSDSESVDVGREFTSGKECLPCIVTTGDIVKATRLPGFEPSRSAFLMPTTTGPCRFGQYNRFQRIVLDQLGLDDVRLIQLTQTDTQGYRSVTAQLGSRFARLTWKGCVLVDLLQKACRQTRPYERSRGDCDTLYAGFLERIEAAAEQGADLLPLAREIAKAFASVPVDRARRKPRIGIIGEIYVRSNAHCNNHIARRLEDFGAEVALPTFQEWVEYIAEERKRDELVSGGYLGYLLEVLTAFTQEWDVRRLTRPFRHVLTDFLYEASTREVVDMARPYIDFSVRGEAVLSMGRAVEYAHRGFDGVVNVIPFSCMPGTIVDALLERFRELHPDMPILKMAYDGVNHVGEDTRIEAFIHQARQRAARRVTKSADPRADDSAAACLSACPGG